MDQLSHTTLAKSIIKHTLTHLSHTPYKPLWLTVTTTKVMDHMTPLCGSYYPLKHSHLCMYTGLWQWLSIPRNLPRVDQLNDYCPINECQGLSCAAVPKMSIEIHNSVVKPQRLLHTQGLKIKLGSERRVWPGHRWWQYHSEQCFTRPQRDMNCVSRCGVVRAQTQGSEAGNDPKHLRLGVNCSRCTRHGSTTRRLT